MATKQRKNFRDSEEGQDALHMLELMTNDSSYITPSSYSADSLKYPDNLISFIDRHMNYLTAHPDLDAKKYIANLRLMARIR